MGNKGKGWETKFRTDWEKQFPEDLVYRLKDQMSEYKDVSKNECDFLIYTHRFNMFLMVECKEHKGISLPFSAFSQYERLLEFKNRERSGIYPGVLIWFREKDKLIWCSIDVAEQILKDGTKSISLSMIGKYDLYEVPFEKQRIYLKGDYEQLCKYLLDRKK